VKVGVHECADGRPHYAWLPLAGRAAAGSVGGEVCCLLCIAMRPQISSVLQCAMQCTMAYQHAVLQVHLRLQWRENEREADAEATAKFSFEVCIARIDFIATCKH
jgi:hypothetical protein